MISRVDRATVVIAELILVDEVVLVAPAAEEQERRADLVPAVFRPVPLLEEAAERRTVPCPRRP